MTEPWAAKMRRVWRAGLPLAALAALVLAVRRFAMPRGPGNATGPAVAGADTYRSENPGVAFEPSDWALGPVALVYVGTLVLLIVSSLVLIVAYPTAVRDVGRSVRIAPPGPRLETNPQADLRRFRAQEDKRLNTYYWVNKSKGVVHIPIEQAMRDLAAAGIPGFPKRPQ
jgi:hypothetical protein